MNLNSKSININTGAQEDRMLLSGLHTVCDIFCKGCFNLIGWKYVKNKKNYVKEL